MADVKIYYSNKTESSLITKPTFLVNYSNRLPDSFEMLEGIETPTDHLTSLEAKSFYYKIDGENTVNSNKTQLNGLNNLLIFIISIV